jgi:hypothetical protein
MNTLKDEIGVALRILELRIMWVDISECNRIPQFVGRSENRRGEPAGSWSKPFGLIWPSVRLNHCVQRFYLPPKLRLRQ